MRLRFLIKSCVLALSVLAGAVPAFGLPLITVEVYPSSAPNVFGSPSWAGYLANATTGIENHGAATGTPGQPTFYESGGPFGYGDFMVTSFNSWKGVANPGAPFENEFGNRMHFGMRAEGDGVSQFSLSQMCFDMNSSDPANALDFDSCFTGADVYNEHRVGIDYGADNARGGGDDTVYNAGQSATTLVDLLLYRGAGNSFWPDDEADMANVMLYMMTNGGAGGQFVHSTRYWFTGPQGEILGEGTGYASPVPEPGTMLLLSTGLIIAARKCFAKKNVS